MAETDEPASLDVSDAHHGTIAAPSPILFVLTLIAGAVLDRLRPVGTVPRPWNRVVGIVSFALGSVLFVAAVRAMRRHETSPAHEDTPPALITSGPFRYTRNPIYVGNCLQHIGVALLLNNGWAVALTAPLMAYLDRVVTREEAYLEERFGEEFRDYSTEVSRWV